MKVFMINGSPHEQGTTSRALQEMSQVLQNEGIEVEIFHIGNQCIRGCIACGTCKTKGKCVFDDIVNEVALKFKEADGLVVGTPVYYAGANGTLLSFLDRLFYSSSFDKTMKVGCAISASRRSGNTSAFDEINKYFTITSMPVVSSTYWNEVYGFTSQDVEKDEEGLQTIRNLGRNMAFLIKSIQLGKEKYGLPHKEKNHFTSFSDGK